jgi:hypothetical protein
MREKYSAWGLLGFDSSHDPFKEYLVDMANGGDGDEFCGDVDELGYYAVRMGSNVVFWDNFGFTYREKLEGIYRCSSLDVWFADRFDVDLDAYYESLEVKK